MMKEFELSYEELCSLVRIVRAKLDNVKVGGDTHGDANGIACECRNVCIDKANEYDKASFTKLKESSANIEAEIKKELISKLKL